MDLSHLTITANVLHHLPSLLKQNKTKQNKTRISPKVEIIANNSPSKSLQKSALRGRFKSTAAEAAFPLKYHPDSNNHPLPLTAWPTPAIILEGQGGQDVCRLNNLANLGQFKCSALKKKRDKNTQGPSLAVQWLRLHLRRQGVRVWSLVGGLRSHMPCGPKN